MGTPDDNDRKKRESGYNSRGRFEQWTKNPTCEANTLSSVLGTTMDIPARALKLNPTRGQSAFAIARGKLFERNLFRDNAKIFLTDLSAVGLIGPDANPEFIDLRQRRDGGKLGNIDESLEKTRRVLVQISKDKTDRYHLLAGPVVKIPGSEILLPEALLIIDVLIIKKTGNDAECTIGEIKTYPDRAGFTDAANLASARAQAGMYLHALQCVIEDLKIANVFSVNQKGFLVLSKAGSLLPSIRSNEDLRYMAKRTKIGFENLRVIADRFAKSLDDKSSAVAIINANKHYKDECLKFCDLAPHCRKKAEEAGLPSILGHQMEQFTHGLTLHQVIELIEEKRLPSNQAEEEFLYRYRSAGGAGPMVGNE